MKSYEQTILNGLVLFKNELNEKLKLIGEDKIVFSNEEIRQSRPCLEAIAFIPHHQTSVPFVCSENEVGVIRHYSIPIESSMLTSDVKEIIMERRKLLECVLNKLIAIYGLKISAEQRKLFINPK